MTETEKTIRKQTAYDNNILIDAINELEGKKIISNKQELIVFLEELCDTFGGSTLVAFATYLRNILH